MPTLFRYLFLLVAACTVLDAAVAQAPESVTLEGAVRDAETGQPLPAANIYVDGTRRGTITNAQGHYRLRVDRLPATVVFRYVGYQEERVRVTASSPAGRDVALSPVTAAREQVVVTAQRPTAAEVMRRVIAAKQRRRRQMRTFEADAYTRFVVRNDTGIVSVVESLSAFFWDRERGVREVVRSQRQTENLSLRSVLPAGLFVTNLYDDEVEVAGHRLMGVTHPDALDHYTFRIDSVRVLGDRAVYDIAVEPRGRLQSGFTGHVVVLDEAFALLEANLEPARSFLFPQPLRELQVAYRQQFSNFGGDFWLPTSLRSQVAAEIQFSALLAFPRFRVEQVSRFSDYDLNVDLPDSLYRDQEGEVFARSGAEQGVPDDSLISTQAGAVVPLSSEEQRAVATIDSTQTLGAAFAPTGPLARVLNLRVAIYDEEVVSDGGSEGGGLAGVDVTPHLWFNRVEGVHVGARVAVELGNAPFTLSALGGYQTARSDWTYGGEVGAALPAGLDLSASYRRSVVPRYASRVYGAVGMGGHPVNSVHVLLGGDDYFDYYGSEHWGVRASRSFEPREKDGSGARLHAGLVFERAFPVARSTSYDIVGRAAPQPVNPAVPSIQLRTLTAGVRLGAPDAGVSLGVTGQNRLQVSVEWSPEGGLGSEAGFVQVQGVLDYRQETFFRRRLLPMTLDLRLTGATYAGDLPLQRYTIVEAPLGPLGPFGTLRTLEGRPYQGTQHLALFWEHNFRTVPFEVAGLYGLARRGWSLLLFGGHGRAWGPSTRAGANDRAGAAWIATPGTFHHEVGLSLNGLSGVLRVDLAKRLDAGGWAVGVGLGRLF